ncbi:hypothetical protein OEZ86_012621 [Tetradesmus obliquus]|nr:hypothetical protein OEZ86_012621 [Tetradesmus obliquus]
MGASARQLETSCVVADNVTDSASQRPAKGEVSSSPPSDNKPIMKPRSSFPAIGCSSVLPPTHHPPQASAR